VLEATKYDSIKNYWNDQKTSGVRLVKLCDLISSIDAYLAIRPIVSDSFQISHNSLEWAKTLEFDPKISSKMNMLTLFSVGVCPLLSQSHCSKFFSFFTKFNCPSRHSVFCSEFVSKLLQKEGHIKKEFNQHWTLSPIHFTSSLRTIDNLCSKISWEKEILFICSIFNK
jgi:hypothetical protein